MNNLKERGNRATLNYSSIDNTMELIQYLSNSQLVALKDVVDKELRLSNTAIAEGMEEKR
jgi:hypothetical protein